MAEKVNKPYLWNEFVLPPRELLDFYHGAVTGYGLTHYDLCVAVWDAQSAN
jgi:hypothetical protein